MGLDIISGVNSEQRPKDEKIWHMFGAQRVFLSSRISEGEKKERQSQRAEQDQSVN